MNGKEFNAGLIKRFCIELSKKDRGGIYGLTQRMMTYNSNKLEGSTLTEKQTANLFDTGSVWGDGEIFRAKDIEEANGHFLMFNHMITTIREPLTENLIKQFHFYLKNKVFEDMANGYPVGDYKNRRNFVGTIQTALPEDVPEAVNRLLQNYQKNELKTMEDMAKFHADFERIHPFQDGNGRTGRMILFRECIRNDMIPFIIMDEHKTTYYNGLQKVESEGSYSYLADYFKSEQQAYYELAKDFIFPSLNLNRNCNQDLEL